VVPFADLPPGRRVVVFRGDEPVEVRRDADGIVVRSLLCTHMGCRVRWNEEISSYDCPCHNARFDADGRPVLGPATRPLAEVPFETRDDAVVLPPPAR
jgi:Rieske Fe-S protein